MTNDDDDLTGIFDDLTPEDFLTTRSGIVAFDRFVQNNIYGIRMAYLASEGQVNPIAVLANPTNEWTFTPTEEENMGQYVGRLREAAKTLGATFFFITRKTQVGALMVEADEDVPSITDPKWAKEAEEQGHLTEGLLYYAERYENGERDCRHGIMREEDNGELGRPVEGNPHTQTIGLFSNMLS